MLHRPNSSSSSSSSSSPSPPPPPPPLSFKVGLCVYHTDTIFGHRLREEYGILAAKKKRLRLVGI